MTVSVYRSRAEWDLKAELTTSKSDMRHAGKGQRMFKPQAADVMPFMGRIYLFSVFVSTKYDYSY